MNKFSNTKKVLAGIALASSAFFTLSASAAIIPAWDWTSDGGFVNGAAPTSGAATCSNGALQANCSLAFNNGAPAVTPSGLAGTSSIMSWGTGSNGGQKSALQAVFGGSSEGPYNAQAFGSGAINIPAFSQIVTNAGWTTTGAAIHYNNVITKAGGNMITSTLATTFQLLTPGPLPVSGTTLNIGFNETPNQSNCAFANPHATNCDDIFTLGGSLTPVTFTIGGQIYKLSFRFADGPGAIVDGNTIYTAEDSPGTAVIFVQGRIDTIPLPGILALMGLGLVMIGLQVPSRRRKLV